VSKNEYTEVGQQCPIVGVFSHDTSELVRDAIRVRTSRFPLLILRGEVSLCEADAMKLTEEDISSFIEMWEAAFGERLSRETAESEAKRLIDFFLTLGEEHLELAGSPASSCDTMAP
jgi:hypothetical protein